MKSFLLTSLILISSVVLSSCGGSPAPGSTPPAPVNPASQTPAVTIDGAKLYQSNCAACHGANAAGGLNLGQIVVPAVNSSALQSAYRNDIALIKKSVLNGKDEAGKDLDAAMPRWTGKLSDAEVDAIIKYLQTLR